MMKKTYQNPTLQVVSIQTANMLAASPGLQKDEIEAGGIEARESDFDDEE